MPPDRPPPDHPAAWIERARSNLIRAGTRTEGVFLEDLCFDAHQAAEKAIKGVLVSSGTEFPFVHDLGMLLDLAVAAGHPVPETVREAESVTRFAVATRYPGLDTISDEEYRRALLIAEAVVRWASDRIGS